MSDVYTVLERLNIPYTKREHPPVFTTEEAQEFFKDVPGGHCKNLFLRNGKGDRHYLVIIPESKKADLKKLKEKIGEQKLSFGSPDRLQKYLGVLPGSVSVFGLIHDADHVVKVIVDTDLLNFDTIHFHPNDNRATLEITRTDFKKFLDWTENPVQFLEI